MIRMAFARWENLEACSLEMMEIGHNKEDADKICGDIKERAEKGELYKAEQTELDIISKGEEGKDLVVGGWASWELIDPQRDIITTQAQSRGLTRFFNQEPEYQSITVNHKEFQIGRPLLKYVDSLGKEYFSHVNEKGTYLISKIRNDKLKTTQVYRAKILNGAMGMYSISGIPLESQVVKAEDGMEARRVDDIEYWAVTLCEKGVTQAVNPKAVAGVISKSDEALYKSVEKRGDQWCVIHCSGPDIGKPIKCFDTKEEAEAMHAAIEANKNKGLEENKAIEEAITKDDRPPEAWWNACMARAEGFADDPEAFCGDLWYNGPAEKREAFGKAVLKDIETEMILQKYGFNKTIKPKKEDP